MEGEMPHVSEVIEAYKNEGIDGLTNLGLSDACAVMAVNRYFGSRAVVQAARLANWSFRKFMEAVEGTACSAEAAEELMQDYATGIVCGLLG